jgi:hypothetical protein
MLKRRKHGKSSMICASVGFSAMSSSDVMLGRRIGHSEGIEAPDGSA